jgi:uncharacterized membrane protein
MKKGDGTSRKFRINYLYLIIAAAYAWIVLDSFYNITLIYNLYNNFWIMDSVTVVQSLSSAIFSHLPFVNNIPGGSYFSVHSSPILYVLLPFYSISPGFSILYVIEDVIQYSPAVVLYLIARKKMGNDLNAFLISFSYLFFNIIITSTFEILSLFAGLFIFAYYFYMERRTVPFLVLFLLALSTMEFAPVLGGMFGLVLIILELTRKNLHGIFVQKNYAIFRRYYMGLSLIVISVVFFVVDLKMTYLFSSNTHSILSNLYGTNVTSASSIFQGLMTSQSSKISYLTATNSQYLFLSFLDPIALMQIPWYLAIWISVFPYFASYYQSYTFPFVVLGAISGISRLGKLAKRKNVLIRVLVVIVLVMMVVTWISAPLFTGPSNVSIAGLGAQQVAETLPSNASVYSDVFSYPIIASYAWNTVPYGSPRNFTVFSSSAGPPYSLSGYGLYSDSGTYLAYEKNYTAAPVLNDFYYESDSAPPSLPGAPYYYSVSLFLPKGLYLVSANLAQKSVPGIETVNPGPTSDIFVPVTEQAVQMFSVNRSITAQYVIVDIASNYGTYGFSAKITSSLNPYSTPIASTSFSGSASETNKIIINGPFTLNAGESYYIWLGTSGYPGGISIPLAHGSGLEGFNTTTGVFHTLNNSLQFSIVGNIPGYKEKPTYVIFSYQNGGQSTIRGIYLTGKGATLETYITSTGNFSMVTFQSSYAYGSFMLEPLVIKSVSAPAPSDLLLQNADGTLAVLLIPAYAFIFLSVIPLSQKGRKFTLSPRYPKYAATYMGSIFIMFLVVFSLGYYNLVPLLYNVHIFAAFGYLLVISALSYILFSYLSSKNEVRWHDDNDDDVIEKR